MKTPPRHPTSKRMIYSSPLCPVPFPRVDMWEKGRDRKMFAELTRVRRTHQQLELVPPSMRQRSDLTRGVLRNWSRHLGTRSFTVVLDLERRLRCSL